MKFTNLIIGGGVAIAGLLTACNSSEAVKGSSSLDFNPDNYKLESLAMPSGDTVQYKAYEGIFYVENVEDSTYQTLNIYMYLPT